MSEEGVERKLTTILAADVVGYSRLMGADEVGTLKALKTYRTDLIDPKIAEHNGRIVKLMGDGALVEFPSVVEAVECAVEIQSGMAIQNDAVGGDRQIQFRIGINVGDVIVEGDDLYGDGINVAARLEGLADPGGICISRTVRDQIRDKLDLALDDLGEIEVKNISRPVRAFRVLTGLGAVKTVTRRRKAWRIPVLAIAAAVVVVAMVVFGSWQPWTRQAERAIVERPDDLPAIAVLPFNNLSGDPEQGYFSDGITEDLITDLSHISGLFVIARHSSFAYKGKSLDLQEVAQALGVRYVLVGSVRRAGNQVRINAELIDTETDGHIWADRYDGSIADVFDFQDQVTKQIVSALAVALTPEEQSDLEDAPKVAPEAYDAYLQANKRVFQFDPESYPEAVRLFEQAIALDPGLARAHAGLALSHGLAMNFRWVEPSQELAERAENHARAAMALDVKIPQSHLALAMIYTPEKRYAEAIDHLRRAIELDPNYADGHALLSARLSSIGQPEESLRMIREAKRLSPRHGFMYQFFEGRTYFTMKRYEEAIPLLKDALERNPTYQGARLVLISIYGQMDRFDEAEWEISEILVRDPDFSITAEKQRAEFGVEEVMDRYIEGLRKAGLPK